MFTSNLPACVIMSLLVHMRKIFTLTLTILSDVETQTFMTLDPIGYATQLG